MSRIPLVARHDKKGVFTSLDMTRAPPSGTFRECHSDQAKRVEESLLQGQTAATYSPNILRSSINGRTAAIACP